MNRLLLSLFACVFFALTACESTPDPVYEPEPEPEAQPYVEPKPEPKPEPLPARLDKSRVPGDRPAQAFARKTIDPKDYARPTFAGLLDGAVADWRRQLDPPFVEGKPHAMQNVQTSGSWWNGIGSLKVESQTLSGGGWKAHGYGEATYNSNGKLLAKGYFREGRMHGHWIFYNEDESLESVRCYKAGALDGPYAEFQNGVVTSFGYSRGGVGRDEWWYWDEEGNLEFRTFWTVREGKTEKAWEHQYDAEGKLLYEWHYKDGKSTDDVIAWRKPDYDDKGNLTNPTSVDRLELKSYKNGKSHGWHTMYDHKHGFREYDTWYENGEQTGPFFRYNFKGETITRGQKLKGNNYGNWTSTDADGNTREYAYDAEGRLHGRYVIRKNGKVIEELTYDHGEIEGVGIVTRTAVQIDKEFAEDHSETWIGRGNADENGRFDGDWTFTRADGSLAAKGSYSAGQRSGEWKFYHADGVTVRTACAFVSDVLNGDWQRCFENGQAREAGKYAEGDRNGEWTTWYANGQVESKGRYALDSFGLFTTEVGEWVYYREDGTLRRKGSYDANGLQTGLWSTYDEEGVLTGIASYAANGVYEGMISREKKLDSEPAGTTIDPHKMTGTWAWMNSAGSVMRRAVMINGEGAGLYQQYYPNGTLAMEGELIGQAREGTWKVWTENGVLKEQADYAGGRKNGAYASWRADGTKVNEGSHTDDVKTGTWKTYHTDGETAATEYTHGANGQYEGPHRAWAATGQLTVEGSYTANKKEGPWKEWHPDGKAKLDTNYVNGEVTGLHRVWFANGQLSTEGTYTANKPSGEIKRWNEQGQLLRHEIYDEQGLKQGTWKTWHANGQQATESTYKDNEPTGTWKEWDKDGNLKSETNHDQPAEDPDVPEEG